MSRTIRGGGVAPQRSVAPGSGPTRRLGYRSRIILAGRHGVSSLRIRGAYGESGDSRALILGSNYPLFPEITSTGYTGLNPAGGYLGQTQIAQQDVFTLPLPATISLRLDVGW